MIDQVMGSELCLQLPVFVAILRDARLWRAPQDEDPIRGESLTLTVGGDLAAKKVLILRRPPWAAVSRTMLRIA
jgi:hypothetical protein